MTLWTPQKGWATEGSKLLHYSLYNSVTSRFKESRTGVGDEINVKSEFKREIDCNPTELLGSGNRVFNKGEISSGWLGFKSLISTMLSLRYLSDISK